MAAVIESLCEAMNAHDLDGFLALMHPDYRSEQPAHPNRGFGGRDQVRENWSRLFAGIPDFSAELVRMVDDGPTAWTEWHWTGTHRDGTRVDVRGVTLFEVRDGKIVAGRLYMEPVEHDGADIRTAVREMAEGGSG